MQGLLEFSSYRKRSVSDQDLGQLFEQTLHTLESELTAKSLQVRADYATSLPKLRLDPRALKHVLINLLTTEINGCRPGGEFLIRTYLRAPAAGPSGKSIVVAEVETRHPPASRGPVGTVVETATVANPDEFGLMVARKIIELYGGKVERRPHRAGSKFTISFST